MTIEQVPSALQQAPTWGQSVNEQAVPEPIHTPPVALQAPKLALEQVPSMWQQAGVAAPSARPVLIRMTWLLFVRRARPSVPQRRRSVTAAPEATWGTL